MKGKQRGEICQALQYLDSEECDERIPTPVDWQSLTGKPATLETVTEEFGSWDTALYLADVITENELESYRRFGTVMVVEAVVDAKELLIDAGKTRCPRMFEVVDKTGIPANEFLSRFGTWSNTLDACQPSRNRNECRNIPRNELLRELERVACVIGSEPSKEDIDKHSAYSPTPFQREFGSVVNARRRAGLGDPASVAHDEFAREVERVAKIRDGELTTTKFAAESSLSHQTAYSWYSTWDEAMKSLGINEVKSTSRQELIRDLQRVAGIVGHSPTIEDIETYSDFTYNEFHKVFGGIKTARREAEV